MKPLAEAKYWQIISSYPVFSALHVQNDKSVSTQPHSICMSGELLCVYFLTC